MKKRLLFFNHFCFAIGKSKFTFVCLSAENRVEQETTRMNGMIRHFLIYLALFHSPTDAVPRHACAESRKITDGHIEVTVNCSASNCFDVYQTTFPEETTDLILRHSCIQTVPSNAFRYLRNLLSLDLSHNGISSLQKTSFHGLSKLRVLNLDYNDIRDIAVDTFSELYSLEVLMMSGEHQLYALPILPVQILTKLKVLSLTIKKGDTIPAAYYQLPQLNVVDFSGKYKQIVQIDAAWLNGLRSCNISSLAFRGLGSYHGSIIREIEPGAFSNISSLRSLNLCCNPMLGFKKTVAALAQTQNSNIDTVVLNNIQRNDYAIFDMSDFCDPFWHKIRRLNVRNNELIGMVFTDNKQCLGELRELVLSGNRMIFFRPSAVSFSFHHNFFPSNLCSFSLLQQPFDGNCRGREESPYYDVTSYFPNGPSCVKNERSGDMTGRHFTSERIAALGLVTSSEVRMSGREHVRDVYVPPSWQIFRVEHSRISPKSAGSLPYVLNFDNNVRYISTAYTTKFRIFVYSLYNFHQLQTLDMSHGKLERFKPHFVPCDKLNHIDVSHNMLRKEELDFHTLCTECTNLESINVSFNRLKNIDPRMFATCTSLRHILLNGNALEHVELELTKLTRLDTLGLHTSNLRDLSSKFTTELDRLYKVKKFTLDIRNNNFLCSCESVAFVRWIQTTQVDVTERRELTCLLNNKKILLIDISASQMEEMCSNFSNQAIVIIVLAIIFFAIVVFGGLLWNRWYIKYRIILCNLSLRKERHAEHDTRYDAMVHYFAFQTREADTAASRKISAWVLNELLPLAENEEGLRLFVYDRDAPTMFKEQLFVYGFMKSDKLIICITPELLNDDTSMDSINLALASKKSLSQYILINFCRETVSIRSKQLCHLMKPTSAATNLIWNDNYNEDELRDFRRRLRVALTRGPGGNGCLGVLAWNRQPTTDDVWGERDQLHPLWG